MRSMPDPRTALARLMLPDGFSPTWDIVAAFPEQGRWSDEDYLELERVVHARRFELVDGRLEVLPLRIDFGLVVEHH